MATMAAVRSISRPISAGGGDTGFLDSKLAEIGKKIMKNKHHFTSEEKLKWIGYGEWVEEPDEINFIYAGYKCTVMRTIYRVSYESLCGGHLCGYVCIPKNHPWHGKRYEDIICDCHGGLSYAEQKESGEFWIGFDCAHSGDAIPSVELGKKTRPELIELQKEHEEFIKSLPYAVDNLFKNSYKNCQFVIDECTSIADQANACLTY